MALIEFILQEDVEVTGLAPEGDQLLNSGLSSSLRKETACLKQDSLHLIMQRMPVGPSQLLQFIQDRFSATLSPSTLKVYVEAIAAYNAPLGDGSLGRHQLISFFLSGLRAESSNQHCTLSNLFLFSSIYVGRPREAKPALPSKGS